MRPKLFVLLQIGRFGSISGCRLPAVHLHCASSQVEEHLTCSCKLTGMGGLWHNGISCKERLKMKYKVVANQTIMAEPSRHPIRHSRHTRAMLRFKIANTKGAE